MPKLQRNSPPFFVASGMYVVASPSRNDSKAGRRLSGRRLQTREKPAKQFVSSTKMRIH